MIKIDGSHGEGGGSLLRQSIALSLITKKPFRIINIRSNRPNPGLNNQHLASVELAQKISTSKVVGAYLGSQTIEFYPGDLISKEITHDIESAGSVVLALQSVLLPCVLAGKKFKINIKGGTDVSWSPPVDYFKEIFLPCLEQYSKLDLQVRRRGYYPKGKGEISLQIKGNTSFLEQTPLNSFEEISFHRDELGKLIFIKGSIFSSKKFWSANNSEKAIELSKLILSGLSVKVDISSVSSDSENEGGGFLFFGVFENSHSDQNNNFVRLGVSDVADDENKLMHKIEKDATILKKLIVQKTPCDDYLTDQLIPLIGVVGGSIAYNALSEHSKSNIYLTELFLNKKIEIDEKNKIISSRLYTQ